MKQLMQRNLSFDIKGIERLERAIKNSVNSVPNVGCLSVHSPIKEYLKVEEQLTPGELLYLYKARESGRIENITATYEWAGEIQTIQITVGGEEEDDFWQIQ